jgi:organic hydroperoxide reductase OsmC/OhrA
MHPFPHQYTVGAAVRPDGDVPLSSPGVRVIESAPPKEFDGPGNQWSPEQLLTAAVADCLVLNFRAIAAASKFRWLELQASTRGTLDKAQGIMRFTRFETHAKLHVPAGTDLERAKRLLEKAEASCPVANSLSSERHLSVEIVES